MPEFPNLKMVAKSGLKIMILIKPILCGTYLYLYLICSDTVLVSLQSVSVKQEDHRSEPTLGNVVTALVGFLISETKYPTPTIKRGVVLFGS